MIHAYLAHPLTAPTRELIDQNRANAAKWAAWLWRQKFVVQCSWIVCTGELEETPENRELGLISDCMQVAQCDVMALCGSRTSSGMFREAGSAKLIVDFTYLGLELPPDWLKWSAGRPMTLVDVSRVFTEANLSVAARTYPTFEETASRVREALPHRGDCAFIISSASRCDCGAA